MSALPPTTGDTVYLVPRTIGAARECWSRPRVTVVRTDPPNITVRLPDGREITTHELNVVRELPRDRKPRPKKAPPTPPPADWEDVPLFDLPDGA